MIYLKDRFTTQGGKWDYDPGLPYGIDAQRADHYQHGAGIPGAGADHHIMVNAPFGALVYFNTEDRQNPISYYVGKDGWVNLSLFKGSSYDPGKNEKGTWIVWVNGERVADGIGLPNNNHVSTWLIVGETNGVPVPPVPGPTPPMQIGALEVIIAVRSYLDELERKITNDTL
jgi:hypothetical protein